MKTQMKKVAKKEVKEHEQRMHKKAYAGGGTVMRGAGCATKGKKIGGPLA